MRMTADLTTSNAGLAHSERFQAFASSFVVTVGAGVAALAFVAALLVSLPLMLAASATFDRSGQKRRGWRELEMSSQ